MTRRARYQTATEVLLALPLPCAGLSLGLCGAGSVLLEFARSTDLAASGGEGWPPSSRRLTAALEGVALAHTIAGAAVWVPFTASRLCLSAGRAQLRAELRVPLQCFAFGAWQMALMFAAARLIGPAASNAAATALVHAGAALQLLILANFLHRCRREGERPAPFWNPPTVNCAATAIVAAELGAAPWLPLTSMGLALLLQLLLTPPQVWRVLRDHRGVSASAAVGMMQAPCSLTSMTWGALRRKGYTALLLDRHADNAVQHTLFGLGTLVLWLNFYAVWRRRRQIRERGFGLDWVAWTFPSCSSAVAAMQYSGLGSHGPLFAESGGSRSAAGGAGGEESADVSPQIDLASPWYDGKGDDSSFWLVLLQIYGVTLGVLAYTIVLFVFAGVCRHALAALFAMPTPREPDIAEGNPPSAASI